MDSVQSASSVISYTKQTPVFVGGKEAHFGFSKSQSVNPRGPELPPGGIHNVLLCTILNPSIFSITVEVMYAIMSPYGPVARIVVFNKNNTPQVLVEYPISSYIWLSILIIIDMRIPYMLHKLKPHWKGKISMLVLVHSRLSFLKPKSWTSTQTPTNKETSLMPPSLWLP